MKKYLLRELGEYFFFMSDITIMRTIMRKMY